MSCTCGERVATKNRANAVRSLRLLRMMEFRGWKVGRRGDDLKDEAQGGG